MERWLRWEKVHAFNERFFRAWCLLMFCLACFSSLVRMDYNVAISMIAFFFVDRNDVRYALDREKTKILVWISGLSVITDVTWVGVYSHAAGQYSDSNLPELTGITAFGWGMATAYLFIKVPFVVLLVAIVKRDAPLGRNEDRAPPELSVSGYKESNSLHSLNIEEEQQADAAGAASGERRATPGPEAANARPSSASQPPKPGGAYDDHFDTLISESQQQEGSNRM